MTAFRVHNDSIGVLCQPLNKNLQTAPICVRAKEPSAGKVKKEEFTGTCEWQCVFSR
jgi:hypothetical protein